MNLKKTTEYAFTILGFMATRDEEMYSAEYLHDQLNIPRRYLRRLLTDLSRHGFLKSTLGRSGGFVFAKALQDINFLMVLHALEGPDAMTNCFLGFSCCVVDHPCVMHNTWVEARSKMIDTLSNTSLADLREKYQHDTTTNLRIL